MRVTGTASPPVEETRKIGALTFGAKRIAPSEFQAPPRPAGALASSCTKPLSMSSRFRLPFAKKPIERLSGDQNGNDAPSVFSRGRTDPESSDRSHNRDRPSEVARNTIFCPSGEIATDKGSDVDGVVISTRISGAGAAGRFVHSIAAADPSTITKADTHKIRSRLRE